MHFKKWTAFLIFFALPLLCQRLCFEIDKLEVLDAVQPFALDKLTCSSNINFDKKEFNYLVGLNSDEYITNTLLQDSCFYLKQKNKFKKICVTISGSSKSPIHKNLHFDLYGHWTFNCLTIQGVLIGKDAISEMYRLEHGDKFDAEKHKHSVSDIKKHFFDNGFFDCRIKDSFESDSKTKSIKVSLSIKKNNRFVIDSCSFLFDDSEGIIDDKIKSKVQEIYAKRFCKLYSKKGIEKNKNQLKRKNVTLM